MRILYYNWVDYLDEEGRGGGVSIYQRNLMALCEAQEDTQATFLASGLSYDLARRAAPRWEHIRHGADLSVGVKRTRCYEIINSGVMAPAHHSFGQSSQVTDALTEAAFFDFIAQTGPYDVIHFNNLEGVPANVLRLKERWPETRVILSLHNYYPICPQVNLWHQERESCEDFQGGARCATCLTHQHAPSHLKLANGLAYRLKTAGFRPGNFAFDFGFRWAMRLGRRGVAAWHFLRPKPTALDTADTAVAGAEYFGQRRTTMVGLINQHCDLVLCVSQAVQQLAQRYGIDPELTRTSYIGTLQAAAFGQTTARSGLVVAGGILTLGYLGYMRKDKGFFFLIDALEALPDATARRIRLVLAARQGDAITMARITALETRLAEVVYRDGYTHDDLDEVLDLVDLGVVPVLWHDNLPQVAIEMHARHIPILTSDMGGAQELGGGTQLVFPAGDVAAFHVRLETVLEGSVDLDAYWAAARTPIDMATHMEELHAYYSAERV